jgi:acyl-coenzyme A thioesterase PaaI-like protein
MIKDPVKAFKLINLYPPLIGAGIKVTNVNTDFTEIDVTLRLTWWNRNVVGTSFGGSLYMMCDPFYMAILMTHLGRDYIVWDKAARIEFLKPGRSDVSAKFIISPDEIRAIRQQADTHPKYEPEFTAEIRDKSDVVIAKVHKTLYVRRKT